MRIKLNCMTVTIDANFVTMWKLVYPHFVQNVFLFAIFMFTLYICYHWVNMSAGELLAIETITSQEAIKSCKILQHRNCEYSSLNISKLLICIFFLNIAVFQFPDRKMGHCMFFT